MNINDLKDVWTICEYGSFRQAAKALGITQPTLSSRIQNLEDQLGVILFDRSRGKSSPTQVALFITERAELLLANADSLIQETLQVADGSRGHLRIGFGPAAGYVLLIRIVRALRAVDSSITLECYTGTTENLAHRLAEGTLDLVIGPFDEGMADPRLEVETLLEDEVMVAIDPQHPLALNPPSDPEEVFKYPIALTNLEPRYREMVEHRYGHAVSLWEKRITCSNYALLLEIVRDRNYVTGGPSFTFLEKVQAGEILVFPAPGGPVQHVEHIIRNRNTYPFPALEQVVEIAREEIRKIQEQLRQTP